MNNRDGETPVSSDEATIEAKIVSAGLTAPRITPAHIDSQIAREDYHVFPGTTVTVCCLELKNGFCIVGESAAASPENFNEQIGRDIARRNARDKIWSLEGYLLRTTLAALALAASVPPLSHQDRVRIEKDALDGNLSRLDAFIIENPIYASLPEDEKERLRKQASAMSDYSKVLGDRIDSFPTT